MSDLVKSEKSSSSKLMSLILGLFTGISRILGFLRQILFVYFFGAGGMADIFNFAFNIPNNLRKLLAEGALSSAYIPEISASLQRDKSRKEAALIVRTQLTFQLLVLVPLTVLMVYFAPAIINFLSDFSDSESTSASIKLFRYLIFYLMLVSISAILMASLNAVSKFVVPGITPVLFSVAVISAIFLFHKTLSIYAMVIGVLGGGLAQILFQIPQFLKEGFSLVPHFDFKSPPFIRILVRYFPVVISSGIFMILEMFAHYLASKMEVGSITAIANSLVIWQLPFGIFSVSIITVLFPKMSRQAHSGDKEGLKISICEGLNGFIAFIIPSTLFLYFVAPLVVSAIYYRGAFTLENVATTASVLKAYSVGLIFISGFGFLQRYFYASNSYLIPFISSVVVAIIDVTFSIIFYRIGMGAVGLAWSNTICYFLGFFMLLICAAISLKGILILPMVKTFLKVAVSMAAMMGLIILFNSLFPQLYAEASSGLRIFALFLLSFCCITVVLLLYILMKVEVFSDIFIRRLKRR